MLVEVVTQEPQALVALRYPLTRIPDEWEIPEVPVPEAVAHDQLVAYLVALLTAWAGRTGQDILVARNLAVRWIESHPRVGIDPDVALIDPAPPNPKQLRSLKLWEPGCHAPRLAIEVVSENHPYKDYVVLPERYSAMGVGELWVLDPGGFGPRRLGGPTLIQQWVRDAGGTLVRSHSGDGPVYSEAVEGWLRADRERGVSISGDADGAGRWLTGEEEGQVHAEGRLEAERQRDEARRDAARLEAKLRAAGIDPDE